MNINENDTALVFTDPQNQVLSEKGAASPGGRSVTGSGTRGPSTTWSESQAAKQNGFAVPLPHGQWVEIQRTSPDDGAREQDGRSPRSIETTATYHFSLNFGICLIIAEAAHDLRFIQAD